MGKAFEKQIKAIEDQGKKQVDALENLKPKEQTTALTYYDDDDYDDESLEQKKESFNKLFDKKLNEIQKLSKKIDYKNLNYNFITKSSGSINFIKFKGPLSLFKKIRDGDILLEMAEEDQEKFRRELGQIRSGKSKYKGQMQLYTIKNVKNLYDSRQEIIDVFNNYSKIKSESIYRSKHDETKGKGLNILIHQQMLQRFPMVLAQVKAGNNSENL